MPWALHVMVLDSLLNGICGLVRLIADRKIPLGRVWLGFVMKECSPSALLRWVLHVCTCTRMNSKTNSFPAKCCFAVRLKHYLNILLVVSVLWVYSDFLL